MARSERGFTLIEVIVAISVVALLIWVALPRSFAADVQLQAAARQLQSDIRYAQELAMTKGQQHQIRLYAASNPSPTNRYEIVTAAGGAVRNPLTGDGAYVVDFNSGQFSGVQLDSTLTLGFNSLGRPVNSLGAPLTSDQAISLNGGTKVLTVTAETGRVSF